MKDSVTLEFYGLFARGMVAVVNVFSGRIFHVHHAG
jgi:hypothetical protein